MISLYPETSPVDPLVEVASEARPSRQGRPWVLSNMVASLDGATAIGDKSGGLGRPSDKELFAALRSVADVILVASGTVNAESYKAPQLSNEAIAARKERGQQDLPQIAVVSSSLRFNEGLELFNSPDYRPCVATSASAPAGRLDELKPVADIITAGEDRVDFGVLLRELHRRGARVVLTEGGPTLIDQLIKQDLIDEWNLSISPFLIGGPSKRPAQGPTAVSSPAEMKLSRLWQGDEMLFGRWVREAETT